VSIPHTWRNLMGRPKHEIPQREGSKRRWVTQAYVAAHLGVTTRTVRDMTNDGRLRGYRINEKFVRYDLNEVDAAFTPYGGSVSA
jgi:hypothetical protein